MISMEALALIVAAIAGMLLYAALLPRWLVRLASQLCGPSVVLECPTHQKAVALTIDDAPSPTLTRKILKVLKHHDCKATFFIIGNQAKQFPDVVSEIHADGHELANHTMVDAPSYRLRLVELEQQMDGVETLLHEYVPSMEVGGKGVKWFRPGHGWFTPAMLALCRSKGYKLALGSVFGNDPWVRSVPLLRWWYATRAYPGAVLIIHDGLSPAREQTVAILDGALGRLKQQGYHVTTLSELYLASTHKTHSA